MVRDVKLRSKLPSALIASCYPVQVTGDLLGLATAEIRLPLIPSMGMLSAALALAVRFAACGTISLANSFVASVLAHARMLLGGKAVV